MYGYAPNPTIDDTKKVVSGTGEGAFSVNINGLIEGKTYYVRAFATNEKGTAYGTESVSFNTIAEMPTVEMQEVANINIAAGTATFVGKVTSLGGLGYTQKGFAYSTAHNPTIDDTKVTVTGTETGVFNKTVNNITEGHTYYVRSFVTNSKGTAYSEEISFNFVAAMPTISTQEVTNVNIGAGTATFNGTIESLGDLGYSEKGFVYDTSHNPTLDNAEKVVASGTGTSAYSAKVQKLKDGSTYYVRAYATNKKGTVYGDEVSCVFVASLPKVNTQAVSNININAGSATFNGSITYVGDPAYTKRGFAYGTSRNPTVDDTHVIVEGTGTGAFSKNVTGIAEGKTYYVRAFATSAKGTAYGEEASFEFVGSLPTVSTQAVSNINISAGTATFNGTIKTAGEPTYTKRGFVYGANRNPTTDNTCIAVEGSGTGAFSKNVTGIAEGKTYYVRAFATSAKGTVYGEEVSLDFNGSLPKVATQEASNIKISAGTATFNGAITSKGEPEYTKRGFAYSTNRNPTTNDKCLEVTGTGTGAFSTNVAELAEGQTYYVRAFAINSKGTAYGDDVSVNFIASNPVVSTQEPTNVSIAGGSATANGTISKLGDLGYTERGFVYGTIHNPTYQDNDHKVAYGSGTGAFNANLTGLTMGSTYYIRAYAKNTKGVYYGAEVTLPFNAVLPTVRTDKVTYLTDTSAKLEGTILTVGDPAYSERGFIYGTIPTPTIDLSEIKKTIVEGLGTGIFICTISNMSPGEKYYIRAYAKCNNIIGYGEIKNIVMLNPAYYSLPTFVFGGHTYRVHPDIGEMSWHNAMATCNDLELCGYDDWYLPSLEELEAMYRQIPHETDYYWSSTQYDNNKAWRIFFNTGYKDYDDKNHTYNVRPIRKEK